MGIQQYSNRLESPQRAQRARRSALVVAYRCEAVGIQQYSNRLESPQRAQRARRSALVVAYRCEAVGIQQYSNQLESPQRAQRARRSALVVAYRCEAVGIQQGVTGWNHHREHRAVLWSLRKVEKLISTQRLQTTRKSNRERTPLAGGTA